MIIGVTKVSLTPHSTTSKPVWGIIREDDADASSQGFLYKMRLVYAHFPINAIPADDGCSIQIRNFLGEKIVRTCPMGKGVTVKLSDVKDEIIISGNDVEQVSQSAASITDRTRVKDKDIRKFLDGV